MPFTSNYQPRGRRRSRGLTTDTTVKKWITAAEKKGA